MTATLTSPMQVIAACSDEVRSSLPGLDDNAVLDLARGMESASRMMYSVLLDTFAEIDSRQLAAQAGFRSTAALVGELAAMHRVPGVLHIGAVGLLMCAERPPGGDRDCAGNVRVGSGEHLGQLAEPGRRVTFFSFWPAQPLLPVGRLATPPAGDRSLRQ